MTLTTTRKRGKRDNPYILDDLFVTMHRSPLGTAWRWRTELLVLGGLAAFFCWLWSQLRTPVLAGIVLAAFLGLVLALPWSRRFTVRRFWCVLSRHRFHRMCFEGRLHTRTGRVPPVLWVRPTRVGERLTIWLRAGLAAEDFEQHTGELRAACYARDARVTRNTQWSQLVTIDIIRRDTLAATHAVDSPFKKLLAERARTAVPVLAVTADDIDGSWPPPWPEVPFTTTD